MSIRVLDPAVHAALVALFAALIKWLWLAVFQTELPNELAAQVAASIVIYLLSLFGYGIWLRISYTRPAVSPDGSAPFQYRPPFT